MGAADPSLDQTALAPNAASLTNTGRKPLKPTIDPYQQGDLDSLCGLYAIINALRLLHREIDEDSARALFRKLVKTLAKTLPNAVGPVYGGMSQVVIEDLLLTARREVRRHHDLSIRVEPLRLWRKRPTLLDLWEALREHLGDDQVAILGLEGAKEHWTVVYAATENLLRLFDSTDRHTLARSRCTLQHARTRVRITPPSVLLIRRKS